MTFFSRTLLAASMSLALLVSPQTAQAQSSFRWDFYSHSFMADHPMMLKQVFNGFGCTGSNLSPYLIWSRPPQGTKSMAITMYDPGAPTGSGWWHWVVFNIPLETQGLAEGASGTSAMPAGAIESVTDYGTKGYGGPCPPENHGTHYYTFTLWALDVEKLDLDANASGAKVGYFLNQHALAKAQITGTYQRESK